MEKSQLVLGSTEPNAPNAPSVPELDTRCDLPAYYRDEADHNAKLEIFKDSPFLSLLRGRHRSKSMPVCRFLLGLYDAEQRAFSLRGKYITLCIEEAGVVLGLRNEGEEVSQLTSNITSIPNYYKEYFAEAVDENGVSIKGPPLNKSSIQHVLKSTKINGENSQHFQKIMYVYLYSFVFVCSTKNEASPQVFGLVDDIELFERINWLKVMFTKLENDLQKLSGVLRRSNAGTKLYFCSFTRLLEAWYYYRTHPSADENLHTRPKEAPIEYYFSETRLENVEKNLNVNHVSVTANFQGLICCLNLILFGRLECN